VLEAHWKAASVSWCAGKRGDYCRMSETIYRGKILNLRLDTLRLEDGRTIRLEIVEHAASIGVLALKDEQTALLVRQHRHAIGETLWRSWPGAWTRRGGRHRRTARVGEETGYRPVRWCRWEASTSARLHDGVHAHLPRPRPAARLCEADEDEQIELEEIPLVELLRQARPRAAGCEDGGGSVDGGNAFGRVSQSCSGLASRSSRADGGGKTDISIAVAQALRTEIVSADSMQVYRRMEPARRSRAPSSEPRCHIT